MAAITEHSVTMSDEIPEMLFKVFGFYILFVKPKILRMSKMLCMYIVHVSKFLKPYMNLTITLQQTVKFSSIAEVS